VTARRARSSPLLALESTDMATKFPEIKESRLHVKLMALDRAEAISALAKLEQRRIEALQEEHLLRGQPGVEAIAITAEKLGLTRKLVRRSIVIGALSKAAKAQAKRLRLDSSQTALYRAAKESDPDRQTETLRLIVKSRRHGSADGGTGR
jgi:hypothetical protein